MADPNDLILKKLTWPDPSQKILTWTHHYTYILHTYMMDIVLHVWNWANKSNVLN